jgi:hypothetical protein
MNTACSVLCTLKRIKPKSICFLQLEAVYMIMPLLHLFIVILCDF